MLLRNTSIENTAFRGGHGGLRYCGIGLFFMRYFGNFDFNVRYCGIIWPCGMKYFIILADGIRGNMIVHGIAVRLFELSFRYNTQNKTQSDIKVNKS